MRTLEQMIYNLGEIPYCGCKMNEGKGCGIKVNVDTKWYAKYKKNGYPKFIQGHHLIGKQHSKETKKKQSDSNKGKHICSEDKKKSISLKNTGKIPWNKGIKYPIETCEKISKNKIGSIPWNKGIPRTQEEKNNISKSLINRKLTNEHKINISKGVKGRLPTKHRIKICYLSKLQGKIYLRSTWELAYAEYLDSIGELYLYELRGFKLNDGSSYYPDFYLINENKFIEIKGWMSLKAQNKINLFKKDYPNILFEIFYRDDLKKLGLKIK